MVDDLTRHFMEARPRLFAVAYRMLGSVCDAEDVLQDSFVRWQSADRDAVVNPQGFLQKTTVRLCLDHLKSARHRREIYPGEWLPEPIVDEHILLDRDVTYALLHAMERLSPLERAAYLLHDIFDQSYAEIAETLERSEASCRQLATRARRNIRADAPRHKLPEDQEALLTRAFFQAAKTGNTTTLTQLLTRDVVLISDGGGKAAAALNPILGREKVIRLFAGLASKQGANLPAAWSFTVVNTMPAILSKDADGTLQATILMLRDGRIDQIFVVRNPDKTAHLGARLGGARP